MSEQGIKQEILIQRPAIDGDEWAASPGAAAVDGLRGKLFACSCLTNDEHVCHDLGRLLDHGPQVQYRLALPYDAALWIVALTLN